MERHLWVVAYDVSDNQTRRRLERTLQAFGQRVQRSVFECHWNLTEAKMVLAGLAEYLDERTDSLRAYPQCAWCEGAHVEQGKTATPALSRILLV